MDHRDVRERLEIAALEPDGLERLWAGDTADSAVIAGHLAGCPTCSEEARRLAVVTPLIATTVVSRPPADLRGRTLTLIRDVGRPPGAAAAGSRLESAGGPADSVSPQVASDPGWAAEGTLGSAPVPGSVLPPTPLRRRRIAWPLVAAAVIVALLGGGLVVGAPMAQRLAAEQAHAEELAALTVATTRISAEPDATRVTLVAADGHRAGALVYSRGTAELAMSANGLPGTADGQVFACWIAGPDGRRVRIGTMGVDGDLAYWTGWSEELAGAAPGTQFGVTLVDASGHPVGPGDLLTGVVGGA